MNSFMYMKMMCKRHLRKISFCIILLMIPIFTILVTYFTKSEKSSIDIGIYNKGDDALSNSIEDYLTSLDGMVNFIPLESEDELTEGITKRKLDCGYILPADFTKRLEDNVRLGAIRAIRSPGSSMASVADEFVITAFLNTYSYDILKNYTINTGDFSELDSDEISQELLALYQKYLISDETFRFTYENSSNEYIDDIELIPALVTHSVIGINALFIMIAGLAGALITYKDKKSGIFTIFSSKDQAVFGFFDVFAPILLASTVTLISLTVTFGIDILPMTFLRLIAYMMLVAGFSYLVQTVVKSSVIFASFMPILIIGSLVFSPVFFDLSVLLPKLSVLKYLFIPTYFICFKSILPVAIILASGLLLSALAITLSYRMEKKII